MHKSIIKIWIDIMIDIIDIRFSNNKLRIHMKLNDKLNYLYRNTNKQNAIIIKF